MPPCHGAIAAAATAYDPIPGATPDPPHPPLLPLRAGAPRGVGQERSNSLSLAPVDASAQIRLIGAVFNEIA
jgi:hypothetical protein